MRWGSPSMTARGRLAGMKMLIVACVAAAAGADVRVDVRQDAVDGPVSGRLVVSIVALASSHAGEEPNGAPFWTDPQPMYAAEVSGLARGGLVALDDTAEASGPALSALPAGRYRAQARLITTRRSSSWTRDAGNLFGEPVEFEVVGGDGRVSLALTRTTEARGWPARDGVELFEVRSALLSEFHGREVVLRAGVVLPRERDPGHAYPAVYEVPGFGGDHRGALRRGGRTGALDREVFWIVLDPESPNGHTLFADSANNGPCGRALVEELIPALEAKYDLAPRPEARLLRGHSSGGWSTLWLAIQHQDVFGATWSTAPDPVDFRRFQATDIYAERNLYERSDGDGGVQETPSMRSGDRVVMTTREENTGERLLGPNQTSGQQWASWQAVFGPRAVAGHPAALYDERTGVIDPEVARAYRAFDIGVLVRSAPEEYAAPFFRSIRVIVGDADDYFLNEAVALLRADLASMEGRFGPLEGEGHGIAIIPGKDHGSVLGTPEARAIPGEMLAHLTRHSLTRP